MKAELMHRRQPTSANKRNHLLCVTFGQDRPDTRPWGLLKSGDIHMATNAIDRAADEARAATNAVADSASKLSAEAQRSFNDAAKRFEKVVAEGLEQVRAQSRTYADNAGQHIDEAQRYVVERVKERPLIAAGAALGAGLLIGLLLASGRKR